uniref:Uncharacterized protein n=1 Tax=Ixodes ricinus TaxID=34613 RepID=A0A6B0V539_IXORI
MPPTLLGGCTVGPLSCIGVQAVGVPGVWTEEPLQGVGDALHLLGKAFLNAAKMQHPAICWAHHAVPRADRPEPRLEGPPEELAQVAVVSQLPVLGLPKVAAEGPGKEAQHGPPQPHGQGNVVGPAPPAGGHAQRQHPVEAHLEVGGHGLCALLLGLPPPQAAQVGQVGQAQTQRDWRPPEGAQTATRDAHGVLGGPPGAVGGGGRPVGRHVSGGEAQAGWQGPGAGGLQAPQPGGATLRRQQQQRQALLAQPHPRCPDGVLGTRRV